MDQFKHIENIIIDNWGGDCIVVHIGENNVELSNRFCDFYKLPENYRITSSSAQATFIWVDESFHQSYNLFIKLGTVSDRVVAHECVHITYRILKNKGMKLKDSSEEAYAYLLDYLYGEVSEIVKRAKIEYKQYKKEQRENKSTVKNSKSDNN